MKGSVQRTRGDAALNSVGLNELKFVATIVTMIPVLHFRFLKFLDVTVELA